jgi:hypothetical protein
MLVSQSAVVGRCGGVVLMIGCGSSHQLKRLQRVEIVCSWALLVVEGALLMALEMVSRL